jgi:hypothetical protein
LEGKNAQGRFSPSKPAQAQATSSHHEPSDERNCAMHKEPPSKADANEDYVILNVEEAADFLRVTRSTLDHYRCVGRGPVYRKHGTRVFYTRESLIKWSESREFSSTSSRIGQSR